jgi:ubiquinone/menaquinone biosynthesis C-methylase UbiE
LNQGDNADLSEFEYPDVETASADYAKRFSGPAGRFMLGVQERAVEEFLGFSSAPAASVLDVGGGHGQLLALYARLGLDVTLHGSSWVCFQRLPASGLASVKRIVSPPDEIPLPDKSMDFVVCVRLLSHTRQWQDLLAEMCRIARFAVVVDYPSRTGLNALTPLLFNMKKRVEKNTRSYQSFSSRAIKRVFRQHGFPFFTRRPLFFLPMVVHRMAGGSVVLRIAEKVFRKTGLTHVLGSPVIARAGVEKL